MNHRIRVSPIRLIGPEGEQLGILPVEEALQRARDAGLDLVEVSPNSRPPVCRVLDYGKFKYEMAKKDKQAKKKQHTVQLKEMRFRPKIDEHDFQFKTKHVRSFLEAGSKVRTFVMFRGREMAYTEHGAKVLERVKEDLSDIAVVEVPPKMEGRHMSMILSPTAEVLRKLKDRDIQKTEQARADREETAPANSE